MINYMALLRARGPLLIGALACVVAAVCNVVAHRLFGSGTFSFAADDVLMAAGTLAAVYATFAAATLPCENESHSAYAWTKPVSRLRYAAGIVSVGAIVVVASWILGLLAAAVTFALMGGHLLAQTRQSVELDALRYFVYPFAWFGLLTALTASLRRASFGSVVGVAWPVAILLAMFSGAATVTPLRQMIWALNLINPMHYFSGWWNSSYEFGRVFVEAAGTVGVDIALLLTIAVAGTAVGLWQLRYADG